MKLNNIWKPEILLSFIFRFSLFRSILWVSFSSDLHHTGYSYRYWNSNKQIFILWGNRWANKNYSASIIFLLFKATVTFCLAIKEHSFCVIFLFIFTSYFLFIYECRMQSVFWWSQIVLFTEYDEVEVFFWVLQEGD